MTKEIEHEIDLVPVLHKATKWEKITDNHYLLYNDDYQTRMYVSYSSIAIVMQINGNNTIRNITDYLTNQQASIPDYERVTFFIQNQLYNNGILEVNELSNVRKRKSHIHFEQMIISEKIVSKICKPLICLFNKQIVYPTVFICLLTIYWIIIKHSLSENIIVNMNPLLFTIALSCVVLFHELGHCTALQYYGKQSIGIGFGFYFFSPVLFADVNPSWILTHKKRMVVDLGGFYFQLIITAILIVLFEISKEITFLSVAYFSLFLFLFNSNPLINTDMYWFISDMFNRANLNNEAMTELSDFLKRKRVNIVRWSLLIFAVLKIVFVISIFILISYSLTRTLYLIVNNEYIFSFGRIVKDIILTLGFFFFIKELIVMIIRKL